MSHFQRHMVWLLNYGIDPYNSLNETNRIHVEHWLRSRSMLFGSFLKVKPVTYA